MKDSYQQPAKVRTDLVHPLNTLVESAAETLEAFTVALYLKSAIDRTFRLISHKTASNHFTWDMPLLPEKSRIATLAARGSISHETHASVPPLAQEIYSRPEPVLAMLIAPISDSALLIVDTAESPSFQPNQIRFVQGMVQTIEGILSLAGSSEGVSASRSEFSSIAELLNEYRLATNISETFFDGMVSNLVNKGRFDGALIVTVAASSMTCRIRSVAGFSKSLNKGRIIKLRPGWAKWSIEQAQSVVMGSPRAGEAFIPIFHSGEALGFPIKSAVIVPWTRDQAVDGFLLMAARKEDPSLDKDKGIWEFLGSILAIVRRNVVNEKLLKAVRLYDGESGLMNESHFRAQTLIKLTQLAADRSSALLILVQIENMDSIYLEHDISRIKRFLTIFTEKLLNLSKRRSLTGKFKTGGFGSFIENIPMDEATETIRRVQGLFSSESTHVDGIEITHSVKIGWSHFPTECKSFEEMWRQTLARVSKSKPFTKQAQGWTNL